MRKFRECIVNQAKELDVMKEIMVCAISYLNGGLISINLCVLRFMCIIKWRRWMTRRIRSGSTSSFVWMACFSVRVAHKPSCLTARPRRVIRLLILMAGCSLVDLESCANDNNYEIHNNVQPNFLFIMRAGGLATKASPHWHGACFLLARRRPEPNSELAMDPDLAAPA